MPSTDAAPAPDTTDEAPLPRRSAVLIAVAVVCLAVGIATGLLVAGVVLSPSTPTDSSVEAGFARDMQVHHAQAVEMSLLVRDRSADEDIRLLAQDIMLTQQQQGGQMFAWLALWGLPQASSAPAMAWMDHSGAHAHEGTSEAGADAGAMPGLATEEQMDALRAAEGVDAERIYLALMIPHHLGGVEMAEAALEHDLEPVVQRLADAVVAAQNAEIEVLTEMLDERGGAPAGL